MVGTKKRICLVPHLAGVGGMVSFQEKLALGLASRGFEVSYHLDNASYSAILVIGGTRQLGKLWRARQRGTRVVQRLDGMNWIHRLSKTSLRHYLRAEYGNWMLAFIRARLSDGIVYQSNFAKAWWERVHGPSRQINRVVYNGVDLNIYTPEGSHSRPTDRIRLLMVEGSLMGGYELGLSSAMGLLGGMVRHYEGAAHSQFINKPELTIVGRVQNEVNIHWDGWAAQHLGEKAIIHWAGLVPHDRIPETDRSAHLLFSGDINAACPNSVIEAMACGTPVVAFDTGAIPELLDDEGGKMVPYGGDPWKLDPPNTFALVLAAVEVLDDLETYRKAARARSEAKFSLDIMVDGYLNILLGE